MKLLVGLFFISFFSLSSFGQGKYVPALDEKVFSKKEDDFNKRFEGFYIFKNAQERRLRERRKGADELNKIRQKQNKIRDKHRKDFIVSRKKKKRPTDEQWLAEIMQREKLHDLKRRNYVKRRNQFRRYKSKHRQIPENEEMGLD